jgi:hypothetical protein
MEARAGLIKGQGFAILVKRQPGYRIYGVMGMGSIGE